MPQIIKNIIIIIFIFTLIVAVLAPYGVFSLPKDTGKNQKETQEDFPEFEEAPEDLKALEDTREATENTKETPRKISPRRPLKFRKFRVMVDIYTKEPQDDTHVRQETKRLFKLAKSVSDMKDIKIIKLQGVSVRKSGERVFNINLD